MHRKLNHQTLNLYLTGSRGLCAGVERAINMVEEALKKYGKPVYVRHEIVHNKYVVDTLQEKGAIFVDELTEITDYKRPVIFSAHGVPKSVPKHAKRLKLEFHDATCPLVSKIHREVENFEKKNLNIILIGHSKHPEVVGTMGQISSKIHLIENINDVASLKLNKNDKIAYVTQTTLSVDDTKSIILAIKKKYPHAIEPKKDDICYATTNRQEAVKKIARYCDLFIVIGAKNSSNSIRLVEVAKHYGAKKSILAERVEKFDLKYLKHIKNIGLTASASAPEILVQNFIKYLKKHYNVILHETKYIKEDVMFKIPKKLKSTN